MAKPKATGRALVIDNPTLERDMSSQAVINRNSSEYSRRLAHKRGQNLKEGEFAKLKAELAELREMIKALQTNSTTQVKN